jgi:hypothetical protein
LSASDRFTPKIVEKESAHLNVSNEIFLPIKADHRTMCHFSDPASQKWISFSSAVVNLARANAETTAILDPPLSKPSAEIFVQSHQLRSGEQYGTEKS